VLIVRFIDADGRTLWGRRLEDGRALPMRGDPFGRHEFESRPVEIARLLAPAEPPNIFAIGLNYRGHAEEQGLTKLPERPLIFSKPTTAVIGPDEAIVLPDAAPNEVDYEAELAVVIGRRCRQVGEEEAGDYILGYTCANDVTARDCQKRLDGQWTRAKGFDTFCPLGPALATADAFDPCRARLRAILNGQVMQDECTSDLIFNPFFLVSYLSRQFTLLPGTVILTGTPKGVGFTRTPPVFLRAGDAIGVEIEGIGRLDNHVAG
jgi:2-keto-4-pentenoate hydratase/2-oxohepta-3-ene-1,7-dioic acid hydratase in catechol pathway